MTGVAIVLAMLLDLAAAAPSALSAEPLRGPFPSLEAACDTLRADMGDPAARCTTARNDECSTVAFARTGPFARIQQFRFANMCYVAWLVERGWYVGETSLAVGDRHRSNLDSVESDGARVVLRIANDYWWHDNAPIMTGWWDRRRGIMVCGLAGGKPVCSSELVIGWSPRWEEESGDRSPHQWRWLYDATLDGSALAVRNRVDAPDVPPSPFTLLPQRPRNGRYALPF
jgi:hypothetical protein